MKIFDLSKIPESEYYSVGGKARGLNFLKKAGLKIADGFVMVEIGNENDIFKAAEFCFESNMKEVAVRSSAVSEDGEDFSYAGQYLSFLNVCGKDDIINSIRKCLGSLKNRNASSYTNFFGQDTRNSMAVIIQKMVKAEKAGVCFTSDPVAGENYMLIEAVQGNGEQLVSGIKNAKQYRLLLEPSERFNHAKENSPGEGNLKDQDIKAGQLKQNTEDGLLNREDLLTIKSQAIMASRFIKLPLDTEWAIDSEGELYWLQARPITTTDEQYKEELDVKLDISNNVITNCNISEMLPGAVTPLSLSTSVNSIDFGMRKMLVKTGVYKEMKDIPPASCALSVSNHLFINLSTLYVMEDYIIGASRDAVELSLCGRVLEDISKPKSKKPNIFVRLNNAGKYFRMFSSKDRARFKIGKIAQDFRINAKDTPSELFSEIDSDLAVLDEAFWLHYITSGHSGAMASALFMMLNKDIKDNEKTRSVISSVLEGIDDIESVDILRSLRSLGCAILEKNPSAALLPSSEITILLKNSKGKIKDAYNYFIQRHGHRSIREAEIRSKSWNNDPEGLADYLKAILLSGAKEEIKENTANRNISGLCVSYKGLKKKILKYLITQARIGVRNREFSKSMCIKVLGQFKIAYSLLAKQMVDRELLPDEDLIYFLQHDEIRQLVNDNKPSLIKKALFRRRQFSEVQSLRFKEIYIGKPVPIMIENIKTKKGFILDGSPASRGKATGRARVVKTIDDANNLERGEIMIAPFTDIGWSPYYCLLGALVTEIGSVLSHGVVVAREYSLPLVANVAGATQIIKTGDVVSVDGTIGKVTILETIN